MASAGGGGIDGAAGTTTKKKKRISDCLVDSDGGDEVAGEDAMPPSPPSPGTPRLRIPMFTCARLRFVRLGRKGGAGRKDQVAAEKSEAASTDSSAGWKAASSGASSTETAGMGLSLLFLLAKTCVELNKMAEVRAEMEVLLREMRDQLVVRTTKVATTTDSPCQCQASSSTRTDGQDAGATSSSSPEPARRRHFRRDRRAGRKRRDGPFYALTGNPLFDLEREPCGRAAASSSAMETASGASETSSEVEDPSSSMAVDVAGAQLQLNCRTEQGTPESSSDGESFIELDGGFGAGAGRGGYSARRWRDSEDGQEEAEEERGDEGVPALELERRLQELLHRRSRERIEELEASLRHAERKVMEKEMEARLWKDTAKLALQPGTRGGTGQ
ncbi:uncharacterized protein [Triticum aestivum]|uniref:uncharacterized protein isoform X2 n=1 Tax=Triticum aestivum TaxID=4565 RepID=UPI001D00DBD8|nr:uncharacterized protein LOC123141327 isoform X2 [Triticum aestivum]